MILLAVLACACNVDDSPDEVSVAEGGVETAESAGAYRVVLGNALTDTLRGRAGFGTVYEPNSGRRRFVIRLGSDFDFAGGFALAHRDTTMPAEGSYTLGMSSESLAEAEEGEFLLIYREGMLRDLRATSGTLELTTVTDTLIVGTFDAGLRGRVAGLDRPGAPAVDVHAVGRFRATRDLGGFVIGL